MNNLYNTYMYKVAMDFHIEIMAYKLKFIWLHLSPQLFAKIFF